jgi:hypothetical protein
MIEILVSSRTAAEFVADRGDLDAMPRTTGPLVIEAAVGSRLPDSEAGFYQR